MDQHPVPVPFRRWITSPTAAAARSPRTSPENWASWCNASDLMTGLPLQSVYASDRQQYHEMQRLMTVVYAPRAALDAIIEQQAVLRKLFGNGWVTLACVDPDDQQSYLLDRDLHWRRANDRSN
ncbi:MAG: putative inorganic carbon transporter subunit DabA [Halioglobus sp.]